MKDIKKTMYIDHFIKMIEKYFDLNFPQDYRNFLENYDEKSLEKTRNCFFLDKKTKDSSVLDSFFYLTNDNNYSILENYKIYKNRIPKNFFPIADDSFGNLILISVKNKDRAKIYFWDHEMEAGEGETPDYSNLTLIADNFDEFIAGLYSDEDEEEV